MAYFLLYICNISKIKYMENKNRENCVNAINGIKSTKIRDSIHKTIYHRLGINVSLFAQCDSNNNVIIMDKSSEIENKLRTNKLLRNIFSTASLNGTAWEEQETGNIYITLQLLYKHPYPSASSCQLQLGKIIARKNGKCNWTYY